MDTPLMGYVVLTSTTTATRMFWRPDWDGLLHADRESAERELAACSAAGHQCVLAEVRPAIDNLGLPVTGGAVS